MARAAFAWIAVAFALSPALVEAQRQPARPAEVLPGPGRLFLSTQYRYLVATRHPLSRDSIVEKQQHLK